MRQVETLAQVPGRSAASVYPVLCDFERYPEYSEAVRAVQIIEADNRRAVSIWECNFQRGILCWTEEDFFDPAALTIQFTQIEGDAEHFSGVWSVIDDGDGCIVRFIADFDLGLPGLRDIIEPIAEQALQDNIRSILVGLLGETVVFLPITLPREGAEPLVAAN